MSNEIPTFSDVDFDAVNEDLDGRASLVRFADPEEVAASIVSGSDEEIAPFNPGFIKEDQSTPEEE